MLELLLIFQIAFSNVTQESATLSVTDGPYIYYEEDGSLKSITVKNDEVSPCVFPTTEGVAEIPTSIPCVPIISIDPTFDFIPRDTVEMPPKLLAVSDLEGNLDHLLQFLHLHNVIDETDNWKWNNNHLLFNGDSVDRGEQVTELLWFIRKLQQQAHGAGGQVHFVLGNHDVMIMAGDIRYTHDKYKTVAELTGIPYHQLFSNNSVLGKWLRNQNSAVQIGPYMFVHAGYSPELDTLQLSLTELNANIRQSLGPPAWPDHDALETSLAWHSKGPLWYRGYFDKHAEKYGPRPADAALRSILTRHNAQAIIVGHTVTGDVAFLDGNKHLIGIDVHWDTPGKGQGLLIEEGTFSRLTMEKAPKELLNFPTGKQEKVTNIPHVIRISSEELQQLLDQGTIVLIDVREVDEFENERIPHAYNFPLSTFDATSIRTFADEKEVVFHCKSGYRSNIAAKKYFEGDHSVKHLEGGITAWKQLGNKTLPKEYPPPR